MKEHSQWRKLELAPQVEASRFSAVDGAEAATSAWVAGDCNLVSDQELSGGEEAAHADSVRAAKDRIGGMEVFWGSPTIG